MLGSQGSSFQYTSLSIFISNMFRSVPNSWGWIKLHMFTKSWIGGITLLIRSYICPWLELIDLRFRWAAPFPLPIYNFVNVPYLIASYLPLLYWKIIDGYASNIPLRHSGSHLARRYKAIQFCFHAQYLRNRKIIFYGWESKAKALRFASQRLWPNVH